jgi:hypothetical protein
MVHVLVFAQYSTSGITAGLELLHGQLLALGGDSYLAWGGCLGHGPAKRGVWTGGSRRKGARCSREGVQRKRAAALGQRNGEKD